MKGVNVPDSIQSQIQELIYSIWQVIVILNELNNYKSDAEAAFRAFSLIWARAY